MSTLGGPLVVETKATQIRQRLQEAILNGDMRPGDRIVLDEIARELGVSKIPLREALSSLEGAGLVVTSPHAGPRVAPLPAHEIRGIYLLREEVEQLTVRLAAERADETLVPRLRRLNEQMRAGLGSLNAADMSALNSAFHLEIAQASSFQSISEAVGELLSKIRRYRAVLAGFPADWESAVTEHDAIIDALAAGDVEAAVATMRSHVHARAELEPADESAR